MYGWRCVAGWQAGLNDLNYIQIKKEREKIELDVENLREKSSRQRQENEELRREIAFLRFVELRISFQSSVCGDMQTRDHDHWEVHSIRITRAVWG